VIGCKPKAANIIAAVRNAFKPSAVFDEKKIERREE
jgi:hypothetical protein